jgi:hypothetical protein
MAERPTAIRRRAGSGDGGRRPPEWQQSGRTTAVVRVVVEGCCSRALDAGASGCTSRQSDTHRIESREVRYPWHPWYGRAVGIDRAVARGGRAVFQCRLEPGQASRSVEVPQWMFDAASCHRMRLGPIPSVSCDALRDLQAVLSHTPLADRDDLRDAQHQAEHGRGGADATITPQVTGPPAVPVSPAVAIAPMGDIPARGPRAGGAVAGSTPARAPGRRRRRRARPGGGP